MVAEPPEYLVVPFYEGGYGRQGKDEKNGAETVWIDTEKVPP